MNENKQINKEIKAHLMRRNDVKERSKGEYKREDLKGDAGRTELNSLISEEA